MTEPLRPPRESAVPGLIGWFAARNAAWGSLLGACISIAWMVMIQDFFFAVFIALGSAALCAVYAAISSVPAFFAGQSAARFRALVVGVVFASTAMALQIVLLTLTNAHSSFTWHAGAFSVLGATNAAFIFRGTRHRVAADASNGSGSIAQR
ncbi:hypothetical protein [Agromyces ramosus]|uniref:hypothetical protein n=1 Tax=Agromyces ramosus TaxID=33879 RepID=UPI00102B5354|nr:hypothetical protein [Agromyces ramosus]